MRKSLLATAAAALLMMLFHTAAVAASVAEIEADPMFAVKEGWAWPVVVIPPSGGWDAPEGESIKYAMRIIERQVSRQRGAIRGREVVFLYASEAGIDELPSRLRQWRGMGVRAIVSFGGIEIDTALQSMCRASGPSLISAEGEELSVIDPISKRPYKYIFALDLPYFARSNAIAEAISMEEPRRKTAVVSDLMSTRLARAADLNVRFLRARDVQTMDIAVPAFRQDHFVTQVYDLEAGGVRAFSVWLDAMATLSIWRTADLNKNGSVIYYCGRQHPILLDADGLFIVDKEAPLERNVQGRDAIAMMMHDEFNRTPADPVAAAKAVALARWVISAYEEVSAVDDATIAGALEHIKEIPLMDEQISIDPTTHRPVSRAFSVLRVEGREYASYAMVDVFSAEVKEIDD